LKWFPAALVVGAVLRALALPLPGTGDVGVWKIWTYSGAYENPAGLYGVGDSPRRSLRFHAGETEIGYPPVVPYELAAVGRLYRLAHRNEFPDSAALTASIKLLNILFEAGFLILLFSSIRQSAGLPAARWAAAAYWLNPAVILCVSVLGYVEPLFLLPAAGALVAAVDGAAFLAGALAAVAVWTKPQAVVLLPAVVLSVCAATARQSAARLLSAACGGAIASSLIIAPVVSAGSLPNLIVTLERLGQHDMLSGNTCNLWWIVGYLLRVRYSFHGMGLWPAITMRTPILGISRVIELGYPNPRLIGVALTIAAMMWALWTARRARGLFMMSALAAFLVHAYATLSAQVHENHLFAAVPFMTIAAAERPGYRRLLWAISAIFALNLNLFYGISEFEYRDRFAVPRSLTLIDLTVLLAVANCAALGWHAAVLKRQCEATPSGL
jgi:hypothetical protein